MIAVKGSPEYYKLIRKYFHGFSNVWNCDVSILYYIVIDGIVRAFREGNLPEGVTIITYKELLEL